MPKVSTPEALLAHVQGEDCGMGATLSLVTFKGILVFIYDTLLFSTLSPSVCGVVHSVLEGMSYFLDAK